MELGAYVLGVDYCTDSLRSFIVHACNRQEVATSAFYYPRVRDGLYCDPGKRQFRQHRPEHSEGLESIIKYCLKEAGPVAQGNMKAISVDATCYPGPFRVDLYKRRFQKYLQAGALIENQNETMLAREYRSDYEQI